MSRIGILLGTMGVLLLAGCLQDKEYSQEEVRQLMQEQLEERIERFRAIRAQRCQEQLLEAAIIKADSILLIMARESIEDPGRPDLPLRPERRRVSDSLVVAPLFNVDTFFPEPLDTVLSDSLKQIKSDSL